MSEIRLYGNDHSPWVQAVMMGLHQNKLDYSRSTVPPPEIFKTSGVMMPAVSFNGDTWELESKDILHRLGYSAVSAEDMSAVQRAWKGVLHRTDFWARFWGEFSLASDTNPSLPRRLVNNFLRSFTILYFFLLIRFVLFMRPPQEPKNYGDQYTEWEERFATMKGSFLGGEVPDSVDLLLFGIIQCHCSIPVPPILALQSDPRLIRTRGWISDMQKYFADYPSLYSGVYFAPYSSAPQPATSLEQLCFWFGTIFMIAFFWATVPLVAILAYRNRNLRR
jgi:hypothetical protein